MKNYTNKRYAAERLVGTIVRHISGIAITPINIAKIVVARKLADEVEIQFPYEELDITPVPLGYCNVGKNAMFIARIPKRHDWKQGARAENLGIVFNNLKQVKDQAIDEEEDEGIPRRFFLPERQYIAKTIENRFPSFEAVVFALKNNRANLLAYNRNFAIDKNMNVFHKGAHLIGRLQTANPDSLVLHDKYWWAKEAYQESIT